MKQAKYELKNALEDYKRRLILSQNEIRRLRDKYEPQCENCTNGCPASEINGKVCSPR